MSVATEILPGREISPVHVEDKRKVDRSGLDLDVVPSEILSIPFITKLCLARNRLSVIPDELCKRLNMLKWLDLRSNEISIIPKAISELKDLCVLLLDDNKIQHLPSELGCLENLHSLNVKNNPIAFPPTSIISEGTKSILEYLRQCNSDAKTLEDNTVEATTNPGADEVSGVCGGVEKLQLCNSADEKWSITKDTQQRATPCKSKLYKKIQQQVARRRLFQRKMHKTYGKLITQSSRHRELLPDDPPQPTMDKLLAVHKKEATLRNRQRVKLLQMKAVQKLKDAEELEQWKDMYKNLQRNVAMWQKTKTEDEIKNESDLRITGAPFDVNEGDLKMIGNSGLQIFRLVGIRPKSKPANMDKWKVLELELESVERDKRLQDHVRQHLQHVQDKSCLAIPTERNELREELISAKQDLDLAIRLHNRVLRRLETLQHFHGSNRRDIQLSVQL